MPAGRFPVRRKKKQRQPSFDVAADVPRVQAPQKKARAKPPTVISRGPAQHQRGRFAPPGARGPVEAPAPPLYHGRAPAYLKRPPAGRLLGDPRYFKRPGRTPKPPVYEPGTPMEEWAKLRFLHPDPHDEQRVLGFQGAVEFDRQRREGQRKLARQILKLKQIQHERELAAERAAQPHGVWGYTKAAPGMAAAMPGQAYHGAAEWTTEKVNELMGAAQSKQPPGRPGMTPYLQNPYVRVGSTLGRMEKNALLSAPDALVGKALVNFAGGDVSQLWKHPVALGVEGAMLYPGFMPGKGARALFAGVRAGVRATETGAEIEAKMAPDELKILRRAQHNTSIGRELTARQQVALAKYEARLGATRAARFGAAYRGVLQGPSVAHNMVIGPVKGKQRTFRARGLEVKIPAARSRTGRGFEFVIDAARRGAGGRIPLVKSEEQRALEELARGKGKYGTRVEEAHIRRLQQLDPKLSDEKQQAIRLVLEGTTPDQAIDHHLALVEQLAKSPEVMDQEQAAYHAIHAEIYSKAKKYLNVDAEGRPTLKPNAPRYMEEALHELKTIAEQREISYKDIGALTDKAIANRLFGPARVRAGARWKEAEAQLREDLQGSPMYAQAKEEAKVLAANMTDDPERQRIAVEAMMHIYESRVRVIGREIFSDQNAFDQLRDSLRFGRGPIPEDALKQSTIIQAKDYWNRLLEGASPEVKAKIPGEGEIRIHNLVDAQRAAYEAGDEQSVKTLQREIHNELRGRGPYLFQRQDIPIDIGDPVSGASYPFYSKVGRVVASFPEGKKIGAQELKGRLKSAQIQDDEIKQAQIDKFLEGKKSVTREEAQAWLDENFLTLEENIRYQHPPRHITEALGEEPGGSRQGRLSTGAIHGGQGWTWPGSAEPGAEYGELNIRLPEEQYGQMYQVSTGHFPGPEHNTIVHIRYTTREVNGKRMLLIEEIQSDWHKAGIKSGFVRPLDEDPQFQEALARQEETRQASQQAVEKVNEMGDWIWGLPGQETIEHPDILAPPTVGSAIERSLGVNLSDSNSADVFRHTLDMVDKARRGNLAGGDYHFEIRPERYQEGIEIGFQHPTGEPGQRTGQQLEGLENAPADYYYRIGNQNVPTEWRGVRAGLYDHEHYPVAYESYQMRGQHARAANIRAAQPQLKAWEKLMSMPEDTFREFRQRVMELKDAQGYESAAANEVRHMQSRRYGVTQMPFEDTWHELGFKRMLAWATDNNFEKIGWLTGEHQAERYNLGNFFQRIDVEQTGSPVPEVGSNEYYSALDESYDSEEFYSFEADHPDWPSEPDEYDAQQVAAEMMAEEGHDEPASYNYDSMDAYWEDLSAWEKERDDRAQAYYDDMMQNYEYERENVQDKIRREWDDHFAENWADEFAQEYGYGEGSYYADEYGRTYEITATGRDGQTHYHTANGDSELTDAIGPDLAERVFNGETTFEGDRLVMGEYGRKALQASEFYDKKFRSFIDKYMKPWDVKSRMEAIGNRRVIRSYDVYYKPHASTVEAGAGHASVEEAMRAINNAVAHSEANPTFEIRNKLTGEIPAGGIGWHTQRQAESQIAYMKGPGESVDDFEVVVAQPFASGDFQIVPKEQEKWFGPEPAKPTFTMEERQNEYEGFTEFVITAHYPDGVTMSDYFNTPDEAWAWADNLTARTQAPTGFPYGEAVHSIDLPTPPEKDWNAFIQYKMGLGQKVDMHDPKAIEEFNAWHPPDKFREFMAGGQPLYGRPTGLKQRRGLLGDPGSGTERGSIWADPEYAMRAVVNFTEHGDITTFVHEVFGHWAMNWLPEKDKRVLAKWAGGDFNWASPDLDPAAAEKVAYAMETYIREGHGPTPIKRAVRSLAPYFREAYDGVDLPDLSPGVRDVFDRMFAHEPVKGGKLLGAEDIPNYSMARVAYQPGRPLPSDFIQNKVAAVSQYILSGGKTIAKGPVDQALNHEYRGLAQMSGYFTPNAIKPTTKDALLAVRITTIHRLREDLLRAASDLPTSFTDIAIKVNPDKRTPKGVKTILDKMRELDHAKGGKLTDKDMELIDFDILEEGSRDIFPASLQDADGEPMDIRKWAQRAMNEQEPIPGIKWIPVEWLDSSGLTPPPGWKGTLSKTMTQGNPALTTWDFFNDVNKLAVLYLNPAYVPINLVGNLVMNIAQQGVFTPINLWRSALMHQWLDGWERKMIDNEMGNGLTASLGTMRGGNTAARMVNTTLGHWANQAVDLIPRRSAFLHEARREGYKTKEQVRALLRAADAGDENAQDVMRHIAYRANDAIVDYERMSPLERAITSRMIFFYPWLKGATRYTMRFPLEHPVQAIALMLAAEHAYTQQKQTMGDVPFYEGFDVPVSTKSLGLQIGIPGIYDGKELGDLSKVFGDYTWVQGKYPMVIDARQMLTFSTPIDIYRAAHGLVTGNANSPSFFDNLTPFLTTTITTLQGYDSFSHKEVPVSLKTFLDQSYKNLPEYREWINLAPASWGGMDAKKRREVQQNAINPRTSEQDWWRLFGSGLAPAPFSTEVAAKRTLANASTKIRHLTELKQDAAKYNLGPVTDQIEAQISEYDDMNHEIKQGMTPMETLDVVAKYYKRHPELPHSGDLDALVSRYATTDARVQHLDDYLRHNLEFHAWRDYWQMRHHIDRASQHAAQSTLTSG